jgi:tetratricopeptide (TPR) repeat protein
MKKNRFFPTAICVTALFLTFLTPVCADVVEEATDAFMSNKPKEAIPLLRTALEEEPENGKLYMYLGIAHEQLEEWDAAVEAYQEGLSVGKDSAAFYFNIGNNYARMGEHEKAIEAYSSAIEAGDGMPAAYLNRANLRVKTESYQKAVADYRVYLSREPDTPQRQNIEKMIDLLSEKLRIAEKERREEERRKKEEERRQKELLDQVLNSLEESSGETKNLQAGTGEVKEYEEDFDIVE